MKIKEPENSDKYYWTEHVKFKMKFYGLSAQRVLSVIRSPQRKEEGIVKNTIAVMKPGSIKTTAGKPVWKQEIWVMYQARGARNIKSQITNPKQITNSKYKIQNTINQQIKIISAWRYPGVSPERNPIPPEILAEIENIV